MLEYLVYLRGNPTSAIERSPDNQQGSRPAKGLTPQRLDPKQFGSDSGLFSRYNTLSSLKLKKGNEIVH